MVRKILLVVGLILTMFLLIGCQTVQGVGRDISSVGRAGEKALGGP